MSVVLTYLNYRGLTVVGHAITTSILAIVIPFALLVVFSVPYVQPSNWLQVRGAAPPGERTAMQWTPARHHSHNWGTPQT